MCAALPISGLRKNGFLLGLPFTFLLAVPTAAMATACILSETGGPVLVLALLIAAREFKFLHGMLKRAWRSPHLLLGRAQGLPLRALVRLHILPNVASQLLERQTHAKWRSSFIGWGAGHSGLAASVLMMLIFSLFRHRTIWRRM